MTSWLYPAIGIIHPQIGGILGSFVTRKEIKGWYQTLKKPWFTPPNWAFAPVWTTLYSFMGYASYLIWRDGGGFSGAAKIPLILYGIQLGLNWLWTPLFFGAHKLGWSLVEISVNWLFIAACIHTFRPINVTASNLMIPYIAWVSLATLLNYSIWRNNPTQRRPKST